MNKNNSQKMEKDNQSSILEKITVNNYQVRIIENYNDLIIVSKIISKERIIAFDTEFDRMKEKYGFNLELIQILARDTIYLIRTFKMPDIKPLKSIFENSQIEKVIYAAGEDIQLLKLHEIYPENLVDLRIISKLINSPANSFKDLAKEYCNVEIDKLKQKSNWSKSNLDIEQVFYAAKDVAYLLEIYKKIKFDKKLIKVANFIEEESANILMSTFSEFEPKLNAQQRKMNPLTGAILLELLQYRNFIAKERNRPPVKIFSNHLLEEIAKDYLNFTCITNYPECPRIYFKNGELRSTINEEIKRILTQSFIIQHKAKGAVVGKIKEIEDPILVDVINNYREFLDNEYGENTSKYIIEGLIGFTKGKNKQYAKYRILLFEKFLSTHNLSLNSFGLSNN